jgi:hypothetical protein
VKIQQLDSGNLPLLESTEHHIRGSKGIEMQVRYRSTPYQPAGDVSPASAFGRYEMVTLSR